MKSYKFLIKLQKAEITPISWTVEIFQEPILAETLIGTLDSAISRRLQMSANCGENHIATIMCLSPRKPRGFDQKAEILVVERLPK